MRKFLAVLAALALAGCATIQGDITKVQTDIQSALAAVSKVEVPDLQAALADAQANSDVEAAACYSGLIPIVQKLGSPSAPITVPGPVLAFQKVRDSQQRGGSSTPQIVKEVNAACGGLAISANVDIAKLLVQIASLAAGAPGGISAGAGVLQAVPSILAPLGPVK